MSNVVGLTVQKTREAGLEDQLNRRAPVGWMDLQLQDSLVVGAAALFVDSSFDTPGLHHLLAAPTKPALIATMHPP